MNEHLADVMPSNILHDIFTLVPTNLPDPLSGPRKDARKLSLDAGVRGANTLSVIVLQRQYNELTPFVPVIRIDWVASALGPSSEFDMAFNWSFCVFGTAA